MMNTLKFTRMAAFTKKTFDKNKDLLQMYAEDYGVKKFTINWRCDRQDISYREGYVVELP